MLRENLVRICSLHSLALLDSVCVAENASERFTSAKIDAGNDFFSDDDTKKKRVAYEGFVDEVLMMVCWW